MMRMIVRVRVVDAANGRQRKFGLLRPTRWGELVDRFNGHGHRASRHAAFGLLLFHHGADISQQLTRIKDNAVLDGVLDATHALDFHGVVIQSDPTRPVEHFQVFDRILGYDDQVSLLLHLDRSDLIIHSKCFGGEIRGAGMTSSGWKPASRINSISWM